MEIFWYQSCQLPVRAPYKRNNFRKSEALLSWDAEVRPPAVTVTLCIGLWVSEYELELDMLRVAGDVVMRMTSDLLYTQNIRNRFTMRVRCRRWRVSVAEAVLRSQLFCNWASLATVTLQGFALNSWPVAVNNVAAFQRVLRNQSSNRSWPRLWKLIWEVFRCIDIARCNK